MRIFQSYEVVAKKTTHTFYCKSHNHGQSEDVKLKSKTHQAVMIKVRNNF